MINLRTIALCSVCIGLGYILEPMFFSGLHTPQKQPAAEAVPIVEDLVKTNPFPFKLDTDTSTFRKKLADDIRKREQEQDVTSLMQDHDYCRILAAHEVLRATGDTFFDEFVQENKNSRAFLESFFADREWMNAYLCSGKVPVNTKVGLRVLCDVWTRDGGTPDFRKYLHLSSAVASVWSVGRLAEQLQAKESLQKFNTDPVRRYMFFKNSNKAGRLHVMFKGLKSWELTFVVGQKCDEDSFEWFNKNVNIPLQRYVDVCWMTRYRGASDFGDHIQGPLFYLPWKGVFNEGETYYVNGGVCGSLSTFGAQAAAAHGIPSYTVGQPGHCAYGVRFSRGNWQGGFGGPDGSTHLSIWRGNIHYVNLAETVFSDDSGLLKAMVYAFRSRLYLATGDIARAEKSINQAVLLSPLHLDLRKEQIALLEKRKDMTPEKWRKYGTDLLTAFGKHSHPAIDLTKIFDSYFLKANDDNERLSWFKTVHSSGAKAPYSWAWNFDKELLNPEFATLGSDQSQEELLNLVFNSYKDTEYWGKAIDWGISTFLEKGKSAAFGRAFNAAIGSATHIDEKQLRKTYGEIILATEKTRSINAFQIISKEASKRFKSNIGNIGKLDVPNGKLVSNKGLIYASSYAHDDPINHINVLNTTGGLIHTDRKLTPHIIVELPGNVEVSGILVVKNGGNQQRMKRMKVSRSVDGATWFPVSEIPEMKHQWRIDPPARTRARWIKIEALNEKPNWMHLRNVLIYAKEK